MAATVATEVIHDGNDAAISGGVQTVDTSGVGTGPVAPAHVQLDATGAAIAAFGTGARAATVQRVTIATDDVIAVTTVIPGTAATNLGKAIDTAAGATDTGVAMLAVRDDALSTLTPVEGDFVPLRTSSTGALHVAVASGAADVVDDAAFTAGTTGVVMIGAAAVTDEVNSGDGGAIAMDVRRNLKVLPAGNEYETVAASQTAQALGGTGATGDYIAGVLVIPASVSPGNVLLLDNATSITVFAGGTNSLLTLHPFFIPLGIKSVSGAWKITTGANVSCIGIGQFTA